MSAASGLTGSTAKYFSRNYRVELFCFLFLKNLSAGNVRMGFSA